MAGLFDDLSAGRWHDVARGLLGPAYEPVVGLLGVAPEFSVGADIRDYQDYTSEAARKALRGDYGQAGLDALWAAAALAGTVLPGSVSGYRKLADELPMDEASRMARAQEMGFDVDRPIYHGTHSDEFQRFDDSKIGSSHDAGYYGRGHYFAGTPGEARYYGPNVEEYVHRARLLDLSNQTGDFTFRGHFKSFAPKLRKIDALDADQNKALKAINEAEQYVDDNVQYLIGVAHDGTEGVLAKVKNPAPSFTDEISTHVDHRGHFPKSKEEALERLKNTFIHEMETFHKDQYPGLGTETASLSDYVRVDSLLGAEGLTRKAKEAGYEGIRYGDEIIIFDPKHIRKKSAKFDPAKINSPNLLAGAAGLGLLAPVGAYGISGLRTDDGT